MPFPCYASLVEAAHADEEGRKQLEEFEADRRLTSFLAGEDEDLFVDVLEELEESNTIAQLIANSWKTKSCMDLGFAIHKEMERIARRKLAI